MLEIKIFLHTIRISTIGDIYNSGELAHPIPKWPQIPKNLVCRFDLKSNPSNKCGNGQHKS
jgi:hypothetical protein